MRETDFGGVVVLDGEQVAIEDDTTYTPFILDASGSPEFQKKRPKALLLRSRRLRMQYGFLTEPHPGRLKGGVSTPTKYEPGSLPR